ncbi:Trp biosynthesis-associated membrane protein [Catenulispora yoronensis]|uniref:Trp biosynthesis-associated membrane protein n=1 Tax=Catenulispora yoronensis TaxID=450799 RepID=UPI0031D8EE92
MSIDENGAASDGVSGGVSSGADRGVDADQPRTKPRRELTITVLLALLGGAVAWIAAGRVWATGRAGIAPDTVAVSATGSSLSAAVSTLGLTAIAGALALLATQRLARRLVGVLLVAVGVGVVVSALGARGATHAAHVLGEKAAAKGLSSGAVPAHMAAWWLLAVLGAVPVVLAGLAAVVRGSAWPGMSSRYENAAPKAARPVDAGSSKDLWDALDRGEDPTEAAPAARTT